MLPFMVLAAFVAAGCVIAARARLRGRVIPTQLSMSEEWLAEQWAARE
jgi:hypothetical protein